MMKGQDMRNVIAADVAFAQVACNYTGFAMLMLSHLTCHVAGFRIRIEVNAAGLL